MGAGAWRYVCANGCDFDICAAYITGLRKGGAKFQVSEREEKFGADT